MPRDRWTLEHGSGHAGLVCWTVFGGTEVGTKDLPLCVMMGTPGWAVCVPIIPHSVPVLTCPREFLRAINHFATTLTEMFLSSSDFELQVGGCCLNPAVGRGPSLVPSPLCHQPGTHPCASIAALEQLFPPGRGFPHPGVPAVGELLPGQTPQYPGQVSPHPARPATPRVPAPGCHHATRPGILG